MVRTSFVDVPCEESDNYRCSANWSDIGYMLLTIDNVQDSRRAYFDINDSEIEGGKFAATHHSPAYVVVPSAATEAVIPPNIHPRDDVNSNPEYEETPEDFNGSSSSDDDSATAAPQQYATYEDPSPVGFAKGALEDDSGADVPASVVADIVPDNTDSVSVEAPVQEVDDSAASDAAVDASAATPIDASVDTCVDPSVDATVNATQTPSEGTSDSTGQFDAVPDCDDTTAEAAQDNNAESASSGPTYSGGLPMVPETPFTWSLRNVTRDVFYSPNAVSVDFTIDVFPDGQAIPCHIKVDLDENVEPMFASWFVEKCENSDWYMSWGYNDMTDSAVATVIK
ncbi:hypothetical protein SCUCBS95973_005361 [Sporothrix curviconia]|uniref:Uncharacterized protein n=1 Tax=Sporothrix curviconia TaxID=1260050 RepID=A0ABP0BW89_9PEZI